MSFQLSRRSLAYLLFMMGFLPNVAAPQITRDTKSAEKAWDELVATKGGRGKLTSIENMLSQRNGIVTRLAVFPNLEWEGLAHFFGNSWVNVFYREKSLLVQATQKGEVGVRTEYAWDWIIRNQLMFVLETKWDRPTVIGVSRRKEGKHLFDFIETRIGRLKVEFGYEPEEMLVRRVYLYENDELWNVWIMDDYLSINGIQMPRRIAEVRAKDLPKQNSFDYESIIFQFNVEYDPKIFERLLKATTIDAWKVKSK